MAHVDESAPSDDELNEYSRSRGLRPEYENGNITSESSRIHIQNRLRRQAAAKRKIQRVKEAERKIPKDDTSPSDPLLREDAEEGKKTRKGKTLKEIRVKAKVSNEDLPTDEEMRNELRRSGTDIGDDVTIRSADSMHGNSAHGRVIGKPPRRTTVNTTAGRTHRLGGRELYPLNEDVHPKGKQMASLERVNREQARQIKQLMDGVQKLLRVLNTKDNEQQPTKPQPPKGRKVEITPEDEEHTRQQLRRSGIEIGDQVEGEDMVEGETHRGTRDANIPVAIPPLGRVRPSGRPPLGGADDGTADDALDPALHDMRVVVRSSIRPKGKPRGVQG